MKRKVIIGYEWSESGEDALALGEVLAEVVDATPVIATVLHWPRNLMTADELREALASETRERFERVRERFAPVKVGTRALADPSPAAALGRLGEQEDASLIVVGSTHRGPVGRVLPGGVATGLLHGAKCAVAVAPRGYANREQTALCRFGVAFDGSAESWSALDTAVGLAERLRAELEIFTVAEPARYGYATAWSIFTTGTLHDYERQERRRLLDLAERRIPAGLRHEARLLTGDPGRVLAQISGDVDLMVAGSRSYGPLRRVLLGSTSTRLVNDAACPVMVLPRGVGDPLGLSSGDHEPTAGRRPSLEASR